MMKVPDNIQDTIFPYLKNKFVWTKWPNGYYYYKTVKSDIEIEASIDPNWIKNNFKVIAKLTVTQTFKDTSQIINNEYSFTIENALNNKKMTHDEKIKYEKKCIERLIKNMNAVLSNIEE